MGMVFFSVLTYSLFLRFVQTLGIRKMDADTVIRWGPQSKPALGGFCFYLVFLLSIASNSIFFDPNQFFLNKQFIGMLLCVTMAFMIGLADDAYDTNPLLKLVGQIGCGTILIACGLSIRLFHSEVINYILTIVWVVGIMNSVNMLDNMDAISALVSACIILCCLLIIADSPDYIGNIHFIILLGSLAAIMAFLWFNWHPSSMYMGDTGSQFLGALLSTVSVICLWNYKLPVSGPAPDWDIIRNIVMVALAFILPITDTTIVVFNRMRRGTSPFMGGHDHTTHNLARLGYSDRAVAVVFFSVAFISVVFIDYISTSVSNFGITHLAFFAAYFLVSLCAFFVVTLRGTRKAGLSK